METCHLSVKTAEPFAVEDTFDLPAIGGRPVLVIDTREQNPLPVRRLRWVRAGLETGDYSIEGAEHLFAVARKTVADLLGCRGPDRERVERELHRLRGYHFSRLLILGTETEIAAGNYRSRMSPRAALASLRAFEVRYRVPIVFESNPVHAGRLVERWACWALYDIERTVHSTLKAAAQTTIHNENTTNHEQTRIAN